MNLQFITLQRYVLERHRRDKRYFSSLRLALQLCIKAILSRIFRHNNEGAAIACDVLLVHPSRKSFAQGRKRQFIEALRQRGLHVEEFVEESDKEQLRQCQFAILPQPSPFLLRWYAAHAAFLLQQYQPKAILTERNGWILPSFIKAFSKGSVKVMHLAHSIPNAQSSRYDYFDYDYYLMFGRSSLEYLTGFKSGFGECTALFAGPYFLTEAFRPEPSPWGSHLRCLFLGSGPEFEDSANYLTMCGWVRHWAICNDVKLAVKPHPRAQGRPWRDASGGSGPQVDFIDPAIRLEDCLGRFDLVVCGYTNAVVDVARAGVPFILLGDGEDYFQTARFSLIRARSEDELTEGCSRIATDVAGYKKCLADFLCFHIENPYQPCTSLVDYVHRIVSGNVPAGTVLMAELS